MDAYSRLKKQQQEDGRGIHIENANKSIQQNGFIEPVFENQNILKSTKSVNRISYDNTREIFKTESIDLKALDEAVIDEYAFAQKQTDRKKAKVKGKTKDKRRTEYQKKTSEAAAVAQAQMQVMNDEQTINRDLGTIDSFKDLDRITDPAEKEEALKKAETATARVRLLSVLRGDSQLRNATFMDNMYFHKANNELSEKELENKKAEFERIIHSVLKMDLSMFDYKSNSDLVKNKDLAAKLEILKEIKSIKGLSAEYREIRGEEPLFDDNALGELDSRIEALEIIKTEYDAKLNLMKNPVYALMGKTQIDSLTDDEIAERIIRAQSDAGQTLSEQKRKHAGEREEFYKSIQALRAARKNKNAFGRGVEANELLKKICKKNKVRALNYSEGEFAQEMDDNVFYKEMNILGASHKNRTALDVPVYNLLMMGSFRTAHIYDIKQVRQKAIEKLYSDDNFSPVDAKKDKEAFKKELESADKNYFKNKRLCKRLGIMADADRYEIDKMSFELTALSVKNGIASNKKLGNGDFGRDEKVLAAVYAKHRLLNKDGKVDMDKAVDFLNGLAGFKLKETDTDEMVISRIQDAYRKIVGFYLDFDFSPYEKYKDINDILDRCPQGLLNELEFMGKMASITRQKIEGNTDILDKLTQEQRLEFQSKLDFFEAISGVLTQLSRANNSEQSLLFGDKMKYGVSFGNTNSMEVDQKYGERYETQRIYTAESEQRNDVMMSNLLTNYRMAFKYAVDNKKSILQNIEMFKQNTYFDDTMTKMGAFVYWNEYPEKIFLQDLDILANIDCLRLFSVNNFSKTNNFNKIGSFVKRIKGKAFQDRIKDHPDKDRLLRRIEEMECVAKELLFVNGEQAITDKNKFSENFKKKTENQKKFFMLNRNNILMDKCDEIIKNLNKTEFKEALMGINSLSTIDMTSFTKEQISRYISPIVTIINEKLKTNEGAEELKNSKNSSFIKDRIHALNLISEGKPDEVKKFWENRFDPKYISGDPNVDGEKFFNQAHPEYVKEFDYIVNLGVDYKYRKETMAIHQKIRDEYLSPGKDKYETFKSRYNNKIDEAKQLQEILDRFDGKTEKINGKTAEEYRQKIDSLKEEARAYKATIALYSHHFMITSTTKNDSTGFGEPHYQEVLGEALSRELGTFFNNKAMSQMSNESFNMMLDKLSSGTFETVNATPEQLKKFRQDNLEGLTMYRDAIAQEYERLFLKYGPDIYDDRAYLIENYQNIREDCVNLQVDKGLMENENFCDKNTAAGKRLYALVIYFKSLFEVTQAVKNEVNGIGARGNGKLAMDFNGLYDMTTINHKEYTGLFEFLKNNPQPMFLNGYPGNITDM
ncbi:MAG: hypothetical protein K6F99_04790 [Lachnospiraceae bacterium]|nr:hypothetical protein [Lachnospiraceae bacterium]